MIAPDNSVWRLNVAAIIIDAAGYVLLGGCPEEDSYWHFPQGGIKAGESPLEALHREIEEEVGLTGCRVLAQYAGLRYEYRHKNKKSKRWLGQQQTYFLLLSSGQRANCSGSEEFSTTRTVHYTELTPELFVPFKREVIERVLNHFFPKGTIFDPTRSSIQRYSYSAGSPLPNPDKTPLFAGGKDEAACHLAALTPLQLSKNERTLAVFLHMEGAGQKKCLRNIAPKLDPLTTHCYATPQRYAGLPSSILPLPGELSILALPADSQEAAQLPSWLASCRAEGIRTLVMALYLSEAKQNKRLAAKGKTPTRPHAEAELLLLDLLPDGSYVIPSDHAWYRDYLAASILEAELS